jgi:hypothetical protein
MPDVRGLFAEETTMRMWFDDSATAVSDNKSSWMSAVTRRLVQLGLVSLFPLLLGATCGLEPCDVFNCDTLPFVEDLSWSNGEQDDHDDMDGDMDDHDDMDDDMGDMDDGVDDDHDEGTNGDDHDADAEDHDEGEEG